MSRPQRPGLTILYRTPHREWAVAAEGVEPSRIDEEMRSAKMVTASPWLWFGPPAIAVWMMRHPHASEKEEKVPYKVMMEAKRQISALYERYRKASALLGEIQTELKPGEPPKPKKPRGKKKAAN